jgi:hypothetical protein
LLGRERLTVDVNVGVRFRTLGFNVTIGISGSLLGLSGSLGRSIATHDSVVWNVGDLVEGIGGSLSGPKEGTVEKVEPS